MNKEPKVKKEGKSAFKKFKNRLSFFIVLIFAAFVFYMGWIQMRIPEGHYALVYTKTGGYDSRLISPGQFVWRWENLFPENLTLHFIQLETSTGEYHMEGFLPSGELYGEYIHRPDAFQYAFDVKYRFSVNEDQFVSLIESGAYDAQALEELIKTFKEKTDHTIQYFLMNQVSVNPQNINEIEEHLRNIIMDGETQYTLEDFRIVSFEYPDTELYERTRAYFLDELEEVRKVKFQAENESYQIESAATRKMELLRQYGEVFSEYPILLQYYDLEKDKIDPSLFKDSGVMPVSP